MGSIMKIPLLNDRFTFKELKNYEKNICCIEAFVFLLLHIYRRHLSLPVRKMCPIPDVPLMGKNIIIFFKNNILSAHIGKKYT